MDNLSPEDRRKTMRAVKAKGTKPERRLCSMLAGMGLKGWQKHAADIPGKPDVVFIAAKVAIFVDGCFWHGCPVCQRKLPETNRAYWKRKITRNRQLAKQHQRKLRSEGWIILRIWEHEINDSRLRDSLRRKIRRAIKKGIENHEQSGEDHQRGKPSSSQ